MVFFFLYNYVFAVCLHGAFFLNALKYVRRSEYRAGKNQGKKLMRQ